MTKLLYIDSCLSDSNMPSRTKKLATHFIQKYQQTYPEHTVFTRNLYNEPINFLTLEDITSLHGGLPSAEHPIANMALQFAQADHIVIAAPMWNLSIPAILKAYIDYISIPNITFANTDQGPVGLCQGKRLAFITTRGGTDIGEQHDHTQHGVSYMEALSKFYGMDQFHVIQSQGFDLKYSQDDALMKKAMDQVEQLVALFH